LHYYQHNIADYRKDTGHLTLLEHGIYRQLLDTYYLDEKPIETQLVIRRLSIKTQDEKTAFESVLSDFFTVSKCGKYHHKKRCDAEIAKYQSRADTARVNGCKGGRPKKPRKTQSVILANPDKTQAKANQEPLTNNQESREKRKSRFIPPSLDDVKAYCLERNNKIDAETFLNFYESSEWMRGKTKIKDWKSCVRTWESRESKNQDISKLSDDQLIAQAEKLGIHTEGMYRNNLISAIEAKQ